MTHSQFSVVLPWKQAHILLAGEPGLPSFLPSLAPEDKDTGIVLLNVKGIIGIYIV